MTFENVITLPKADIGSFFYKRKLMLYNQTTMTSSKQSYCAILTECMSARTGNYITSAFIQIPNKVAADHRNVTELICWFDSCVPQNRNSQILQAILEHLSKHCKINVVTMKYSLAGHSCVQEVDKMHHKIEVAMQVTESLLQHSNEKWKLKSEALSEFFEDATILQCTIH